MEIIQTRPRDRTVLTMAALAALALAGAASGTLEAAMLGEAFTELFEALGMSSEIAKPLGDLYGVILEKALS